MKRLMYLITISLILLLVSCSGEVPNPIVGTYSLTRKDSVSTHLASISLKNDGTYIFAQIVYDESTGTPKGTLKFTGSYEYVLRAFDFTSADGTIYLNLDASSIPDGVTGTFLSAGSNPFFYSWKCDKNNGPQSLTLVVDPDDNSTVYCFTYSGNQNALDDFKPTIKSADKEEK